MSSPKDNKQKETYHVITIKVILNVKNTAISTGSYLQFFKVGEVIICEEYGYMKLV